LDGTQTVNFSATASDYLGANHSLDVLDFETLTAVISPASISEAGGIATVTVTRSSLDDLSQPLTVALTSSDTSEATVPATVLIAANQASATFTITAQDDRLLDGSQQVSISAANAAYISISGALEVTDSETLSISIDAGAISENGGTATGTVTRPNTDNSSPLQVILTSLDTTEATVPPSIVIPAGSASGTFAIIAVDDTLLDGTRTVAIEASAVGYLGAAGTVDVTDFEPLAVTISRGSISELDGSATVTVTRPNTDKSSGIAVLLATSSATDLIVPASVTIDANQESATFSVQPSDNDLLDGSRTIEIEASSAGYVNANTSIVVTDHERLTVAIDVDAISELRALPFRAARLRRLLP